MTTWAEMFTGKPEDFIVPSGLDGTSELPAPVEKILDENYELMPRNGFVQILGHVYLDEPVEEGLIQTMTARRVLHHYPEHLAERLREHNLYAGQGVTPDPLRTLILGNVVNAIAMGGTSGVLEDLTKPRKALLLDEFEARMRVFLQTQ